MAYTDQRKLSGILLFIDFEKAFDTIELSFLRKTLVEFNFGEKFIKWIRVLYHNISSCVMNNGSSCKYFPVKRGVRQGDPLSPYLFTLVIEILAIKIREDADIIGFKVNRSTYKLTMYADDMTLAVSDIKSAKRAFALIKKFSQYSGLKINAEKTEGMWLGQQKGNVDEPLGIAWPKDPIKALGIFYSYNKEACIKANFEDKIDKLKKQLHWWKARKLSLTGKILIVKTLGISKFALISSLLHVPDHIIKSINTIIFSFIWGGKTDKVKRKIIVQSHEKGGLKMINFSNFVQAAKCKWIQRYLNCKNANWKTMFDYFCNKENLGIFLRGNFEIKELPKSLPSYYYDAILSWNNLKQKVDSKTEFIWYNKNFKINRKTVYNKRLFNIGIWSKNDLYENGKVKPFQFWLKRGASNNDFMIWRGLIHLVATHRNVLRKDDINRGSVKVNGLYKDIDAVSQKAFHECFNEIELNSLKECDYKARAKFKSIHGHLLEEEWEQIFSLINQTKVTNNIKDLQFKILHRFLPTNRLLYHMKKIVSSQCTFCMDHEETLEHVIFNCILVNNFWMDVITRWNRCCQNRDVIATVKLVTFGLYGSECNCEYAALNIIICIGKAYIWKTKQESGILSLPFYKV